VCVFLVCILSVFRVCIHGQEFKAKIQVKNKGIYIGSELWVCL
jgi:hypothetical protein